MDKNIKDDILKRFGQQLKKDREKKRISSAELARIAFINKPITKLEKGGTNPTLTTLIKLADALDLEVHEQRFEDIDIKEAANNLILLKLISPLLIFYYILLLKYFLNFI